MQIVPYAESYASSWDQLAESSPMGNFLHTRRFLSYHGNRFVDASVLVTDDAGEVMALFPCAVDPNARQQVISHPGATYGGLVYPKELAAEKVFESLGLIIRWYREQGFHKLIYKSVPTPLHQYPLETDRYALWRWHASLYRKDFWNVLMLNEPRSLRTLRRRQIKRASATGLTVCQEQSDSAYHEFHTLLAHCLVKRHSVQPVHSYTELLLLRDRLPGNLQLWLTRDPSGECCAGSLVFRIKDHVWHTQYIASTAVGRRAGAVDLLLETIVQQATAAGMRHVSFGCSTEDAGQSLNIGLYGFKTGFGCGAIMHDFFEIDLRNVNVIAEAQP